ALGQVRPVLRSTLPALARRVRTHGRPPDHLGGLRFHDRDAARGAGHEPALPPDHPRGVLASARPSGGGRPGLAAPRGGAAEGFAALRVVPPRTAWPSSDPLPPARPLPRPA